MPKAEEILDELHEIRERILDEYEGKPDEVYLRDLHARTAKVIEELGLKPAEPRGGERWMKPSSAETEKG